MITLALFPIAALFMIQMGGIVFMEAIFRHFGDSPSGDTTQSDRREH